MGFEKKRNAYVNSFPKANMKNTQSALYIQIILNKLERKLKNEKNQRRMQRRKKNLKKGEKQKEGRHLQPHTVYINREILNIYMI